MTGPEFADAIDGTSPNYHDRVVIATGLATLVAAYLGESDWGEDRKERALFVARDIMGECLDSVGL